MTRTTPSPRTVQVETEPSYEVRIGEGVLAEAAAAARGYSACALVSDANVAPLYAAQLGPLAEDPIVVPAGESSKSLATLEEVLERLVRKDLDRSACVVALGGGVIGDLAGLAAALYKRGVAVLQCPTTLLSQVDASVGGKTAVNLPSGKNLAGSFHQPRAVFADVTTLATLPEEELASGLGEVLKTALLSGEEALATLERDATGLVARDPACLARQVEACVAFKAAVVARDPHEAGERACLNLGHTFGHGIEHIAGFGRVPHGVAVAAGIAIAFEHATARGILADEELPKRSAALARSLGLPTSLVDLEARYGVAIEGEALIASMRTDKKRVGDEIRLVLPVRAGEVRLDVPLA